MIWQPNPLAWPGVLHKCHVIMMECVLVASLLNRQTAVRDLEDQRRRIDRQKELIDQLAENGQPTDMAEDMLETLENTLSVMEVDLRRYPTPR
jgi:hypothetical protein